MTISVGNIYMERFMPGHVDLLYQLINSPDVRKGMSNSAEISYASHVSWVKNNLLETENVHLFMVTDEGHCKGIALIKNIYDSSGELGIMVGDIADAKKTLLTGKLLTGVLHYFFNELGLENLNISILPNNVNSLNTAKKIGAEFQGQDETYQYFLLKKPRYQSCSFNKLLLQRYQPTCAEQASFAHSY